MFGSGLPNIGGARVHAHTGRSYLVVTSVHITRGLPDAQRKRLPQQSHGEAAHAAAMQAERPAEAGAHVGCENVRALQSLVSDQMIQIPLL